MAKIALLYITFGIYGTISSNYKQLLKGVQKIFSHIFYYTKKKLNTQIKNQPVVPMKWHSGAVVSTAKKLLFLHEFPLGF